MIRRLRKTIEKFFSEKGKKFQAIIFMRKTLKTRFPCTPSLSWFTAITSLKVEKKYQ